jgi:hypothetical protein
VVCAEQVPEAPPEDIVEPSPEELAALQHTYSSLQGHSGHSMGADRLVRPNGHGGTDASGHRGGGQRTFNPEAVQAVAASAPPVAPADRAQLPGSNGSSQHRLADAA